MSKPSKLEEIQEFNLKNNWEVRKDLAKKIGQLNGYDLFDFTDTRLGRSVFYLVRNDTPVGYITTHETDKGPMITSTYLTEIVRKRGLCTFAYATIIEMRGSLISDYERTLAADRVWEKIKADPRFQVTYNDDDKRYSAALK